MLDLLRKRHSQARLQMLFHNISPLGDQAQPSVFFYFPHLARGAKSRAICVAEWAMGVHNPVQARLRRDLEAQRQLGLPKHSPVALSV
jgi:hypothetical protein